MSNLLAGYVEMAEIDARCRQPNRGVGDGPPITPAKPIYAQSHFVLEGG
jgi:hypothetical protein